jgi:hypothetical protein
MNSTLDTRAVAQRALDYIAEHPKQHRQANWVGVDGVYAGWSGIGDFNMCDTTMCIAGTVVYNEEGFDGIKRMLRRDIHSDWIGVGAAYLGLDRGEAEAIFIYQDEEKVINQLRAIAEGDETKFWEFSEEGGPH